MNDATPNSPYTNEQFGAHQFTTGRIYSPITDTLYLRLADGRVAYIVSSAAALSPSYNPEALKSNPPSEDAMPLLLMTEDDVKRELQRVLPLGKLQPPDYSAIQRLNTKLTEKKTEFDEYNLAPLAKVLGRPIGRMSDIDGDGDGFITGPDGEDNIPAPAAAAVRTAVDALKPSTQAPIGKVDPVLSPAPTLAEARRLGRPWSPLTREGWTPELRKELDDMVEYERSVAKAVWPLLKKLETMEGLDRNALHSFTSSVLGSGYGSSDVDYWLRTELQSLGPEIAESKEAKDFVAWVRENGIPGHERLMRSRAWARQYRDHIRASLEKEGVALDDPLHKAIQGRNSRFVEDVEFWLSRHMQGLSGNGKVYQFLKDLRSGVAPKDADAVARRLVSKPERRIAIQMSPATLTNFLEGGRYKNLFENNGVNAFALAGEERERIRQQMNYRLVAEQLLFGLPIAGHKRSSHPVYGFFHAEGPEDIRDHSVYGPISVVMKRGVEERSTMTAGDSLAGQFLGVSPLNAPDGVGVRGGWAGSVNDRMPEFDNPMAMWSNIYHEAQIFGGVKVSDISYIALPHDYQFPNPEIEQKLKDLGIPIVRLPKEGKFEEPDELKVKAAPTEVGELIATADDMRLYETGDDVGYIQRGSRRTDVSSVSAILKFGSWILDSPTNDGKSSSGSVLSKILGKPIGAQSEFDGDGDGMVTGPTGEDNIPAPVIAAAQAAANAAKPKKPAVQNGKPTASSGPPQPPKPSGPPQPPKKSGPPGPPKPPGQNLPQLAERVPLVIDERVPVPSNTTKGKSKRLASIKSAIGSRLLPFSTRPRSDERDSSHKIEDMMLVDTVQLVEAALDDPETMKVLRAFTGSAIEFPNGVRQPAVEVPAEEVFRRNVEKARAVIAEARKTGDYSMITSTPAVAAVVKASICAQTAKDLRAMGITDEVAAKALDQIGEAQPSFVASLTTLRQTTFANGDTMGDTELLAYSLIKQWAHTSNNSAPLSLAIQEAGARFMADIHGDSSGFVGLADIDDKRAEASGVDTLEDKVKTLMDSPEARAALDAFVGVKYARTQEYLEGRGADEVDLFRGVEHPELAEQITAEIGDSDKAIQDKIAELRTRLDDLRRQHAALEGSGPIQGSAALERQLQLNIQMMEVQELLSALVENKTIPAEAQLRPLSSFSTSQRVAEGFSNAKSGAGVMLRSRVPRELVVSTALTGSGCLNEHELIVSAPSLETVATIVPIPRQARLLKAPSTFSTPLGVKPPTSEIFG